MEAVTTYEIFLVAATNRALISRGARETRDLAMEDAAKAHTSWLVIRRTETETTITREVCARSRDVKAAEL